MKQTKVWNLAREVDEITIPKKIQFSSSTKNNRTSFSSPRYNSEANILMFAGGMISNEHLSIHLQPKINFRRILKKILKNRNIKELGAESSGEEGK